MQHDRDELVACPRKGFRDKSVGNPISNKTASLNASSKYSYSMITLPGGGDLLQTNETDGNSSVGFFVQKCFFILG